MAQTKSNIPTKRLAVIAGILNEELGLDPEINIKGKKAELIADIVDAGGEMIPDDQVTLDDAGVVEDLVSLGIKLPWVADTTEDADVDDEDADEEEAEEKPKKKAPKKAPKKASKSEEKPAKKPAKKKAEKKAPRLQRPLVVADSFGKKFQTREEICEAANAVMEEAGQSNMKQTIHVFNVYVSVLVHTGVVELKDSKYRLAQ